MDDPKVKAPTPPPLNNQQKSDWNGFLDFVDKSGYRGSPLLDQKDKNMGMFLFQKYQSLNPHTTITYNDVPRVQSELQNYRNDLVNKYKSGKVQIDGIKSEDEIMPDLSVADGWLGSKTSSHKFPVATLTQTNNDGTTVTNFGTNLQAYDNKIKGKP